MIRTRISTVNNEKLLEAQRRSLFWRIHFWAALIASPFALVAAFTGILYIFTPQIESALYGKMDRVVPAGAMRPLDDAVAAANAAMPEGLMLRSVVPAYNERDSVKVYFAPVGTRPGHEGHDHGPAADSISARPTVMYVNPYTAEVLGSQVEAERFGNWSRKLHSSLLQGDGWRWMIELAASWLMIMLITGIVLWWPSKKQNALPQKGTQGRPAWRQWHAFIGIALSLISLIMVATGLTWSKYAGEQIRGARDLAGQAPPQAPRNLKSAAIEGATPMNWQSAWDAARRQAPDVSMQLTAPRGAHGVWRAASFDRRQPEKKFDLVLDAYSGNSLYYAGWDRQTAFGKATAIGIPFHRGEFGWWNQAVLLMFGLGILFSLVSGWVMYFKRRQSGALGLPRLLPGAWTSASPATWVTAIILSMAMPLLGLSAGLVLITELLLHWRMRKPATA
ncbi:PepSY-associated TM helix domain-containing protein [Noviherbaspirillum saxi]|uniref:PepSY domain-containing protein n=1 Tax=Noviherbaspirillum saxi TaxID=2320863 RepID=A0A3A3FG07_9BURK|nr:PepSY-associated TM helix domain-containing protein [Noviherbaspirillum saxi]RJF92017.1 PepSY domain-containing protein [Noviherbaspirillum saxi]